MVPSATVAGAVGSAHRYHSEEVTPSGGGFWKVSRGPCAKQPFVWNQNAPAHVTDHRTGHGDTSSSIGAHGRTPADYQDGKVRGIAPSMALR